MTGSTAAPAPSMSDVMDEAFKDGMADLTAQGAFEEAPPAPVVDDVLVEVPIEAPAKSTDTIPAATKGGAPAPVVEPAIDPYEGTTPLALTINGQPVTVAEILLADGGGLIPPDKLPLVQDRLMRGMAAEQQVQQLTAQARQSEHTLSQLSHTVGEDTYRGLAALEAIKAESAATLEGSKTMMAMVANPQWVYDLALAHQNGDKATAERMLQDMAQRAGQAFQISQMTGLRAADKLQMSGPPPAPLDEQDTLSRAIDTLMAHESLKGLNAEDRALAIKHFGPFANQIVRAATAEDAAKLGLKPGEAVAEYGKMHAWMLDRVAYRQGEAARATEQQKQLKVTGDAAAFNARVAQSRQPVKAKPKAEPPRDPTSGQFAKKDGEPTPKTTKAEKWNSIFEEGMAELNIAR